ncbi:MAG TPA: hypothetical protein IGS53_14505 [Leptolyngbyaceae cyanobacterium M33_DOE_097]|uniref:Uncharacterized protein n=1 Tax=Oscillatoriales cyanobacterium SpSt-418 TaxID=2282169 RepID=A0A7C3PHS0_9CYAN|nr:hypothetical protein [Leptolyngbyaceae cyanobacterium M33_DOE_097]
MSVNKRYGQMFQLATKAVKYYLLGVFGFVVFCAVAAVMNMFNLVQPVLHDIVSFLLRLAALLGIFTATAIVAESLRR